MILRMMTRKSNVPVPALDPIILRRMMIMEEYLTITDTMVCTGCCATLDHIVTYLFKKVTNKGESKRNTNFDQNVKPCCLQLERKCADLKPRLKTTLLWLWSRWHQIFVHFCDQGGKRFFCIFLYFCWCCQMRPEILQQMLQTVLNIIMFEDCRFLSILLRHPFSNTPIFTYNPFSNTILFQI